MPENTLDGITNHEDGNADSIDKTPEVAFQKIEPDLKEEELDSRPFKRRKVAESPQDNKSPARPVSPPWKPAKAEGPTSFIQDGRRKSGRTNLIPLELQPQSKRRQTRAAFEKVVVRQQRHMKQPYANTAKRAISDAASPKSKQIVNDQPVRRGPGRPPKSSYQQPKDGEPIGKQNLETKKPEPRATTRVQRSTTPKSPRVAKETKTNGHHRKVSCMSSKQSDTIKANGHVETETEESGDESDTASATSSEISDTLPTIQKVTFRVRLPNPIIATPANIPLPRKYSDFLEFLNQDENEPRAGEDLWSEEQITQEARMRRRVREAQRPGQIIDRRILKSMPDKQVEPRRQYAHQDHLLAHVCHFRTLLRSETQRHRRAAATLALEAKRYVEQKHIRNKVKTVEEIQQEEYEKSRLTYKQVVKDVDKLWAGVLAEVNSIRQKQYEEVEQAKVQGKLDEVLDRAKQMLNARVEGLMQTDDDDDDSSEDDNESTDEDSEDISDSSDTDADSQDGPVDADAEMSLDDLRKKYTDLPDLEHEADANQDDTQSLAETAVESHVEAADTEDSDPDIEMDSELDSESDDGGSYDENAGDESDAAAAADDDDDEDGDELTEEGGGSLMSMLFSKKQIAELAPMEDTAPSDTPERIQDSDEEDAAMHEEPEDIQDLKSEVLMPTMDDETALTSKKVPDGMMQDVNASSTEITMTEGDIQVDQLSLEASSRASPNTSTTKTSEPESASSISHPLGSPQPSTVSDVKRRIKTPVPHLLRGTLREYQHEGLDWMADLYANGRNGILADEMGLGKTIQSISVLAHLAVEHEVWGPHLIVVPTSVMLNWEMEFKKFLPGFKILTYYGSLEERKQKRRGWMADDSFNVCITSYQLVLQDANSFKRRKWHYMILDEAHNIKNFKSDRWQTMMTFNTRARLLLTGTPLQNNLTELWSLLFFLQYGAENDDFASLGHWKEWFKKATTAILEEGKQNLNEEERSRIMELQSVIRPYLLRRLKADVEKQMPLKYEHVEMCRLSKRQRQLYDGFMSRAQTKETLASGNYLSIINALMQLRKVCNHPDLFETRPISTSFAMPKSVAASFEIKNLLVKRRLLADDSSKKINLVFLNLTPISDESLSMIETRDSSRWHACGHFKDLRDRQVCRSRQDKGWDGQRTSGVLESLENVGRRERLRELDRIMYFEAYKHNRKPVYGRRLFETLTIPCTANRLANASLQLDMPQSWVEADMVSRFKMIQSVESRSEQMKPLIQKYACITPAVTTAEFATLSMTEIGAAGIRQLQTSRRSDPFHEARMRMSIAFPDKRLLQYDCGKLQRLDKLLRRLQAGGHRALIFTQMTKVLDILEQFLNIHGHRYLRLDGATKIEQRQQLTERFNNDNRILAFILSSRSGGLGINLTGADTVIFYDLDWNPAMDKQCTDRAHRIGQTRDVHIYRFVSEYTIESNILRKAQQKQLLDDVVIQDGNFTTDYVNRLTYRDMLGEEDNNDMAGVAMDRVLGNAKTAIVGFERAEDKEDIAAAKVATKEVQEADDGDFEDSKTATASRTESSNPYKVIDSAIAEAADDDVGHIDDYMVKLFTYLMKDVPLGPTKDKGKKKKKKGEEHRVRRPR